MKIDFFRREEVRTGTYSAEVTRASVEMTRKGERLVVTLEPFDEQQKYAEITLWISGKESCDSPAHQFFQAIGMEDDVLDTEDILGEIEGQTVALDIQDNTKDGKTYHNVIGVSPVGEIHRKHRMEQDELYDEDGLEDEEDELDEDEPRYTYASQSFNQQRRRSPRR